MSKFCCSYLNPEWIWKCFFFSWYEVKIHFFHTNNLQWCLCHISSFSVCLGVLLGCHQLYYCVLLAHLLISEPISYCLNYCKFIRLRAGFPQHCLFSSRLFLTLLTIYILNQFVKSHIQKIYYELFVCFVLFSMKMSLFWKWSVFYWNLRNTELRDWLTTCSGLNSYPTKDMFTS